MASDGDRKGPPEERCSSIRECLHTATRDKGDLATEQTGEREEQGREGPSLKKLPTFQENGCLGCTVEAAEGSCQDWAPSGKRSTKWGYANGHLAAPA
jgi:hypothetical protein